MNRVSCPCCRRELVALFDWDYDEPVVELEAVPLRDQPCTSDDIRTQLGLMRAKLCIDFKQFRVFAGNECNWLCNVPSHVTPCDARWNDAPRLWDAHHVCRVPVGLARCLQGIGA